MADREDLDFTYSLIDRIFRRRKHEYVAEQIWIGPGRRVLDLGCGWGPLLAFVRERGGSGIGVTLSAAQAKACRRHGLDVHLRDAREVTEADFGPFDAIASLGAFEHFWSVSEHAAGRQEEIYRNLFDHIADLLPEGGRLYLQTMAYGRNMIPLEQLSIEAPRDSDAWYRAT